MKLFTHSIPAPFIETCSIRMTNASFSGQECTTTIPATQTSAPLPLLNYAPSLTPIPAKLCQEGLCGLTDLVSGEPSDPSGITHASRPYSCFPCIGHDSSTQSTAQELRDTQNAAITVPQLDPRWLSCSRREGHACVNWVVEADYGMIRSA
jgi:hypothetical protein